MHRKQLEDLCLCKDSDPVSLSQSLSEITVSVKLPRNAEAAGLSTTLSITRLLAGTGWEIGGLRGVKRLQCCMISAFSDASTFFTCRAQSVSLRANQLVKKLIFSANLRHFPTQIYEMKIDAFISLWYLSIPQLVWKSGERGERCFYNFHFIDEKYSLDEV